MACATCAHPSEIAGSRSDFAPAITAGFDRFWPYGLAFPPVAPWDGTMTSRKDLLDLLLSRYASDGDELLPAGSPPPPLDPGWGLIYWLNNDFRLCPECDFCNISWDDFELLANIYCGMSCVAHGYCSGGMHDFSWTDCRVECGCSEEMCA